LAKGFSGRFSLIRRKINIHRALWGKLLSCMTMIAGSKIMTKGFLYRAVIPILAIGEGIVPATAQFQWPPELSTPTETAQPATAIPKGKQAPKPSGSSVAGPSVAGNWRGELTQVGSKTPYKLDLVISANGGETKYPDLDCTGKLIRIGASKSYAFYIEIITKGAANKGGRCPDGTITLARAGDNLALLWFGNIDADSIIAYGKLAKK
jgi:hypothetical protein